MPGCGEKLEEDWVEWLNSSEIRDLLSTYRSFCFVLELFLSLYY